MEKRNYTTLINSFVRQLESQITNLRENGNNNEYIYKELATNYALIVCLLTDKEAALTLKDIAPITKVFNDFQNEYFSEPT